MPSRFVKIQFKICCQIPTQRKKKYRKLSWLKRRIESASSVSASESLKSGMRPCVRARSCSSTCQTTSKNSLKVPRRKVENAPRARAIFQKWNLRPFEDGSSSANLASCAEPFWKRMRIATLTSHSPPSSTALTLGLTKLKCRRDWLLTLPLRTWRKTLASTTLSTTGS